jgi:hypothetical protein
MFTRMSAMSLVLFSDLLRSEGSFMRGSASLTFAYTYDEVDRAVGSPNFVEFTF